MIDICMMKKKDSNNTKRIYSFMEARRIARGHGFSNKEEFLEYSCPGAYQLPKNPHELYPQEWKGWDDFLGVPYADFGEAKQIVKDHLRDDNNLHLHVQTKEEYLALMEQKKQRLADDDHPAVRLPYRPDLFYKVEWKVWDDWLGIVK